MWYSAYYSYHDLLLSTISSFTICYRQWMCKVQIFVTYILFIWLGSFLVSTVYLCVCVELPFSALYVQFQRHLRFLTMKKPFCTVKQSEFAIWSFRFFFSVIVIVRVWLLFFRSRAITLEYLHPRFLSFRSHISCFLWPPCIFTCNTYQFQYCAMV